MININRMPDYEEVRASGEINDCKLRYERDDGELRVFLTAEKSFPEIVKLRWEHKIEKEVKILGDTWERGYGNLAFSGLSAERPLPWYFIMTYSGGSCGVGVKVQPNAFVSFTVDAQGVTAFCDVRNGGVGVELCKRELLVASFVSREYLCAEAACGGDNSFEAACEFCKLLSPNPLLPKEPIYGGNNWYYAYGNSSYEEIISDAALQARLAEGLSNRPFMVIDDGWQPNSCAGPWVANEKYRDMKKVADEFKKMGVRPGIWIRPLRDERDFLPSECRISYNKMLDPSHPKVKEYLSEVVKRIVDEWGFELIKHDFSAYDCFGKWGMERGKYFVDSGWHFYDRSKTSAEIYKDFLKLLLDSAGGKAYILGCNCVSHLTAGLCHINRTGDDTSGVEWDRTRKMGVNTLAFRMPQNRSFYMCDADCAGFIKGKIPFELNSRWLELLAKSGTPLFVSLADNTLNEEELAFVKSLYKIASEQKNIARPIDWQYNTTPAK